jgi:hypothetical protein
MTFRTVVNVGTGETTSVDWTQSELDAFAAASAWSNQTVAAQQSRINVERDRRLERFTFGGVVYDFDATSRARIDKARGSALAALIAGAQANDLRWADPDTDFGWIAANNSFTLMDAPTTLAFGNAAAAWEGLHIVAARNLKDMQPVPENYANDSYWPTA